MTSQAIVTLCLTRTILKLHEFTTIRGGWIPSRKTRITSARKAPDLIGTRSIGTTRRARGTLVNVGTTARFSFKAWLTSAVKTTHCVGTILVLLTRCRYQTFIDIVTSTGRPGKVESCVTNTLVGSGKIGTGPVHPTKRRRFRTLVNIRTRSLGWIPTVPIFAGTIKTTVGIETQSVRPARRATCTFIDIDTTVAAVPFVSGITIAAKEGFEIDAIPVGSTWIGGVVGTFVNILTSVGIIGGWFVPDITNTLVGRTHRVGSTTIAEGLSTLTRLRVNG